jgi:parvulin-like peptidyl-prolyl isomerase
VIGLAGGLAGCPPPEPGPLDDLPRLAGCEPDPARQPRPPAERPAAVGLGHLLVAYKGVHQPGVRPRWTAAQARHRAERLAALARCRDQRPAELARRFSDDPDTSGDDGDLGVVVPGQLHPALEAAAFGLQRGQVSQPVHTPAGWHVVWRHAPTQAQASEIVIAYDGAKKYTPRRSRSHAAAAELAAELHQRLSAGASFTELAYRYSDQPAYRSGGFLPIFTKGEQHPEFEQIVWSLPTGGLSEVVETPTGFHLVKRWPVRRVELRLAQFAFAPDDMLARPADVPNRTRALERANAFWRRVTEQGADFYAEAVRTAFPRAEQPGRRLGWIGRGELPLPVERAAFALEPGAVSGVIESGHAFYVVKRLP